MYMPLQISAYHLGRYSLHSLGRQTQCLFLIRIKLPVCCELTHHVLEINLTLGKASQTFTSIAMLIKTGLKGRNSHNGPQQQQQQQQQIAYFYFVRTASWKDTFGIDAQLFLNNLVSSVGKNIIDVVFTYLGIVTALPSVSILLPIRLHIIYQKSS